MSKRSDISELTAKDIKAISDELVEFLIEKAKTRQIFVLNYILDQAKKDIEVSHRLKHDPRNWQCDQEGREC